MRCGQSTASEAAFDTDRQVQTEQSHSIDVTRAATALFTGHSVGRRSYDRCTPETCHLMLDTGEQTTIDGSDADGTGAPDPMLPLVPPRRIPDSSRWLTFGPITSLARSQVL